jgi:filamentous hemagglutinin family protein
MKTASLPFIAPNATRKNTQRARRALILSVIWLWGQMVPSLSYAVTNTTITPTPSTDSLGRGTGTLVNNGGTGTGGTATTFNITGGNQNSGNLFHSFDTFNLGTSHTANWDLNGRSGVSNVINRVIGGSGSNIDGAFTMSNRGTQTPAFFFINPGASINLPGAFYVGTNNGFKSSTDTSFKDLSTESGSSFTTADPAKFGFLNDTGVGTISFQGFGDNATNNKKRIQV